MLLLLFMLIATNSRVQASKCRVIEIPNIQTCQMEVICSGSVNVTAIISKVQYVNCYRQQTDYYRYNYNRNQVNYDVFLKLNDVEVEITEDPLESISSLNGRIKSLSITNGNMILIPNQVYDLNALQKLCVTSTNIESIHLSKIIQSTQLHAINVSHNMISKIETDIDLLVVENSVETIDLSFNALTLIPDYSFSKCAALKFLDLSNNLLTNFDVLTFEGIVQLEILNVSNNHLNEIGQSFARFIKLKILNLNNNSLTNINNNNFKSLWNVEHLNISSNFIEIIEDKAFSAMKNLQQLDMSLNNVKIISNKLFLNSTNLEKLLMSYNKIEYVDDLTFKNNHIIEFQINNNLISEIKERMWEGIFVTELNLSDGNITKLDEMAFSRLGQTLQTLDLSGNFITSISNTSFRLLKNLSKLDLSNNKIKNLDFDKIDLRNITELYLNNNNIQKLTSYSLKNLISVVKLDLSHNNISEIELQSFSDLINLQLLVLSNNTFEKSLPANLFNTMHNLKHLYLAYTRFVSLHNDSFSGMTTVIYINSSYGALSNIEYETFKGSESTEIIDLSHNILSNFIINTSQILNIQELYLNNNKLTVISNYTFLNLRKLRILNLAFNTIVMFHEKGLQSLNRLSIVDLSYNEAMKVNAKLFSNLNDLSEVSLDNIIKPFDFRAAENTSITTLHISHSNISSLHTFYINRIKNVCKLDLSFNKIRILNKDSFGNMSSLNTLDLSFNNIDYIQPGVFLHTNMIHILNLQGNHLHSLEFGVLDGLSKLHTLNMSSNLINVFTVDILHSVQHLTNLLLDSNRITNIKINDFVGIHLEKLSIGGNPIPCDTFVNFFKLNEHTVDITAELLDFHSENVKGITCKTFSNRTQVDTSPIKHNFDTNTAIDNFLTVNRSIENMNKFITTILNENVKYMNNLTYNVMEIFREIQSTNGSQWQQVILNLNNSLVTYLDNVSNVTTQLLIAQKLLTDSNDLKNETYKKLDKEINEILDELKYMNNRTTPYDKKYINDVARSKVYNNNQESVFNSEIKGIDTDIRILLIFISICLGGFVLGKVSFFVYKQAIKRRKFDIMTSSNSNQILPNTIEMD